MQLLHNIIFVHVQIIYYFVEEEKSYRMVYNTWVLQIVNSFYETKKVKKVYLEKYQVGYF